VVGVVDVAVVGGAVRAVPGVVEHRVRVVGAATCPRAGRGGGVGVEAVGLAQPVLVQRGLLLVAHLRLLGALLGLGRLAAELLGLDLLLLRAQLGVGEHLGVPVGLLAQLARTLCALGALCLGALVLLL